MMINCLIVDDEPVAQEIIEGYLEKVPQLNLVAKCSNAMEALSILNSEEVDLIFLDIQMPQITGLEFLRTLKNPPRVILTTAYQEYALESYELDIVDYLLKPIPFERFLKAINKVLNVFQESESTSAKRSVNEKNYFFVKENKELVKVSFADILYVEGLKDYVKIICKERTIVVHSTMINMEKELPSDQFVRIHKSYIINMTNIEAMTGNSFRIGGELLSIGKSYRKKVQELVKTL